MIDQDITIISATDDGFVPHLATLFLSILKTKKDETKINFYVIDDNISLTSKDALNRMVNEYNASISYLQIDALKFEDMVESDRIPKTAYFRIAIPNYLKHTVIKRAIYLDCDIIAKEDIETSEWERRKLQQFPEITFEKVMDGKFMKEFVSYMLV